MESTHPDEVTVEFVVTGVVQGVGFRWFTRGEARRLRLRGWVRNRADGSVQVVAQGARDAVDRLEDALKRGPSGAVVEHVARQPRAADAAFEGFEVSH
jgi:acylphosphatase